MAKVTYKSFYDLMDNYNPETGTNEVVTKEERQENIDFINHIGDTNCIKYLHQYLLQRGVKGVPSSYPTFKRYLHDLWFTLYRRQSNADSSAFEHVFVGEINRRNGEVIGFHNWIHIFLEEKRGRINYKGYVIFGRNNRAELDGNERCINLNFSWGDESHEKKVTTSFMGVSPEFEMALYTLCYLCGGEDNFVTIDDYDLNIKCHSMNGGTIGSAYPTLVSVHHDHPHGNVRRKN
jgi:poly(U)-specific endoribonuclease